MAALGLAIAPSIGAAVTWPQELRQYISTGVTYSFLGNGELRVDRAAGLDGYKANRKRLRNYPHRSGPISHEESVIGIDYHADKHKFNNNKEQETVVGGSQETYAVTWNPYIGCRCSVGLCLESQNHKRSIYGEMEYHGSRSTKTKSFGPIGDNETYMEFSSDMALLNLYYQTSAVSQLFQPYVGLGCGAGFFRAEGCFYENDDYTFRKSRKHRLTYKCVLGASFEFKKDLSFEAEFAALFFPERTRENSLVMDITPQDEIILHSLPQRAFQLSVGISNTF
ncbi:MAG: hypothetical protein LBH53_00990 [Puniceicoccales bacterium]|nr:hypothetical protein [Puniceicoccales bacterium]